MVAVARRLTGCNNFMPGLAHAPGSRQHSSCERLVVVKVDGCAFWVALAAARLPEGGDTPGCNATRRAMCIQAGLSAR